MGKQLCSVTGCDRPKLARGLCQNHYATARRAGALPTEWVRREMPELSERFLQRVEITSGCWIWRGSTSAVTGYGQFGPRLAHRLAYELFIGEIPDGLCVLHHCDNRRCVNPEHFFLGTQADNMADKTAKGRQAASTGHGMCTVSPETVALIREAWDAGKRQVDIARQLGVTRQYVYRIVRRKARLFG